MAPVTEFCFLPIKRNVDATSALQASVATLLKQPGNVGARWSKQHEDPSTIVLFVDWDDISSHHKFEGSDAYGPFLDVLLKPVSGGVEVYHVELSPFPPTVLDNKEGKGKSPVAELCYAYFPADITDAQKAEATASLQKFVDVTVPKATTGENAIGWSVEDVEYGGQKSKVVYMILGWESVETHLKFKQTKDFMDALPYLRMKGMRSMGLFHVSCAVGEKN